MSKVTKKTETIYWTDCEIPAKTFFKILYDNDFSLLGNAEPDKLQNVFESIFDEYTQLDNNERVAEWYKKQCKVLLIQWRISRISELLYAITYMALTVEQRLILIDKLNQTQGVKVNFSKTKPIADEIIRVHTHVLGALTNQLNILKTTESKVNAAVKYSFEKDIVSIENVLGRSVDDLVTLKKFVELKKSAYKIAESRKPKSNKHGR